MTTATETAGTSARLRADPRWVLLLVAVVAYAARLVPTLRGGGLSGLQGYDGSVYFAAAVGLANGLLPYRDFLLLHPPGIVLALLPFALLGRVIGEADAFVLARLACIGLGAVNAVLVSRILAPSGRMVAVLGGLGYAVFVPALVVEHSTALEGAASVCLLGALLLLTRTRPGGPGATRLVVVAGLLLGISAGVKIWGVLFLVAALLWCLAALGPRLMLLLGLGGGLGATVVCLPFFIAAPATMWRMVVLDQLGRRRVPFPWPEKLRDMAGLSALHVRHDNLLLALALVALLVGIGLALRTRVGRLAAVIFAASWLALVTSPSWTLDYASLAGPALAVLLGSAAASALQLARVRWRQYTVIAVLCTGLAAYTARSMSQLDFGVPFPAAELRAAVAAAPGCVTTDDPAALILTEGLQRNLDRGCPLVVDLGGYSYDLQPGARMDVPRSRNQQWQDHTLDYLGSGGATMIVRFRDGSGFSRQTRSVIEGWPEVAAAGIYTVQRPRAG